MAFGYSTGNVHLDWLHWSLLQLATCVHTPPTIWLLEHVGVWEVMMASSTKPKSWKFHEHVRDGGTNIVLEHVRDGGANIVLEHVRDGGARIFF